ncbi:MAG: ABC transporter ATP-binding protein [Alphaproteobacteria bacterium]
MSGRDSPGQPHDLSRVRRWLAPFVRPHLGRLAGVFALSVAASGLALFQPYIIKLLIDDGLIARDFAVVAGMSALMFAAAILGAGLSALNRWHYVTASGRILFALRESVYRHLTTLAPSFFAGMRGGDLMARLDGDVAEVQRFAVDSALALLNGVIVLAGALALMLALSWQLSLIAFALLPAQILLLRALRPRIESQTRDLRVQAGGLSSFLYDTLSSMKFIQSVGAGAREAGTLARLQDTYFVGLRRLQMFNLAAATLPSLLTLLGTVLVFLAGGWMVVEGELTLGTLVAFTAYVARASGPVHTLLGLWVAVKRARVSLDRVLRITGEKPLVVSPENPRALPQTAVGALDFDCVRFAYPGSGKPVLDGASAGFAGGAKIAIDGVSGAGKTTLIDLLQRHYDPGAGRILLDGIDLRELGLEELRARIAIVAQDTVLLAGTVADNIRYAAPGSSEPEMKQAARLAGAAEFIEALPQGYATPIGPRGMKLSGGQRQRLSIARAILQDPLILVFDEATSGVDTRTERAIGKSIDALFAKRTRILVGHRSTLPGNADAVFTLARGKLVARARRKTAKKKP